MKFQSDSSIFYQNHIPLFPRDSHSPQRLQESRGDKLADYFDDLNRIPLCNAYKMQVYPQEKTTDLFAGFIATTVSPETNVSSANHNLRENLCKLR